MMSNKLAMFDKLKNTMQEVEWHSTFDFESYEINAEDKAFIEKKEEFISNSFKKYSSSNALYEPSAKDFTIFLFW